MTHSRQRHEIMNADLSATPSSLMRKLEGMTWSQINGCMKYKRKKIGVTALGLYRDDIESMIMQHGVTIDECAEKFNTSPRKICEVMGWV